MQRTDSFGRFPGKKILFKRPVLEKEYYCFLVMRSVFEESTTIAKIYYHTRFLYKKLNNNIVLNNQPFNIYFHKDHYSNNYSYLISNHSTLNPAATWLNPKQKNNAKGEILPAHQLSLFFEEDEEDDSDFQDENKLDLEAWEDMKDRLRKNAGTSTHNIDFVLPLDIFTYEIILPFLLKLTRLENIQYNLIEASNMNDFEHWHRLIEEFKIPFEESLDSLKKPSYIREREEKEKKKGKENNAILSKP